MWSVVGDLCASGMPGWLRFDGGVVYGSSEAIEQFNQFLVDWPKIPVTPVGPYLDADRTDEVCAFAVAANIMRGVELVAGVEPALPDGDLPPGAIS